MFQNCNKYINPNKVGHVNNVKGIRVWNYILLEFCLCLWMNRKYWKKDACFLHLTFSCSLLEDEWPSALVAWQEKSPAAFFVTLCKTRLRLDTMIPDAMSSERGLSCKNKYQENVDGFKRTNQIFSGQSFQPTSLFVCPFNCVG